MDQRRRAHLNYLDYSGVILDESRSGKTINVQRGFDVDASKVSQKEEAEINSGDSSNIQKSRHSSSSSSSFSSSSAEARRIQLNPTGQRPQVLTTTYDSSGTSSASSETSGLSSKPNIIFHTAPDGSYGFTTSELNNREFHATQAPFDSRLRGTSHEESHGTRENHTVRVENRWGEDSRTEDERTISSSGKFDSVTTDSEKRYQELLRQQDKARLEEEERQRRLQEEHQRIFIMQRRREEEERRQREDERRRQEEQRRVELERRRKLEEQYNRQKEQQQREEEERRLREQSEREHRYNYDEERRYGASSGGYYPTTERDFVTGDREETLGGKDFDFRLRNVSSTQELERLFGTLSKDSSSYQVYTRKGQQYVQFKARFRTSVDRKEYIEFQDGSTFPLQDRYGGQSYISESTEPRDSRFLRIEGRLFISPEGKGYIVLKDDRRFPLEGSYTYTEERSYTLHNPYGDHHSNNTDNQGERTYEQSWGEESSSHGLTPDGGYESKYNTRTHEERRTEERTSQTRVYGNERFNDEFPTDRPEPGRPSSRYKRESDMIDVEEFKKFQRLHRHQRDVYEKEYNYMDDKGGYTNDKLENDQDDGEAPENEDYANDEIVEDYKDKSKSPEAIPTCDAANCVMLRCVLGPLKKDQQVSISARYRVDARTLKEIAFREKVRVSTKLVARVTKQPFIGTPAEQVIRSDEVVTNVEPSAPPAVPDVIPLWVVVLSACAGAIILLLLIFLLYKVGVNTNVELGILLFLFC